MNSNMDPELMDILELKENESLARRFSDVVGVAAREGIRKGIDQAYKADSGKPKVSLVPFDIVYDIARIREYGNNKYPEGGPDNWKNVDIQRYRDALGRHVLSYLNDPDGVDEESGFPHYMHAACNLAFICWMENQEDKESK